MSYGSTGEHRSTTSKSVTGLNDRKLAHSAQMFHYQHQKQQMLELERSVGRSVCLCVMCVMKQQMLELERSVGLSVCLCVMCVMKQQMLELERSVGLCVCVSCVS